MKILNLHGFMGEADNKNYKALCKFFPAEDIISPKIDYINTAPEELMKCFSDMVDTDDFIFVGQSLGGLYADKLSGALLLIHGELDNNTGTFPIQSERFYQALKGHKATVRYVVLPLESHHYTAKENVLHLLYEQDAWLEKYVKNAK